MKNSVQETRILSPLRLLLIISGAIFAAELVIMIFITHITLGKELIEALVDSLLLVLITFPIIYKFSFRPMLQQIEKRTQAEIALQRALENSESRLYNILENAAEAIISIDESQNIILFNRAAERLFGYQLDEIIGQTLDTLIPKLSIDAHRQHVQDFASSRKHSLSMMTRSHVHGKRKNGTEFPAMVGISQHIEGGQKILTAILMDVTGQKKAEEDLRASEERYRSLFDRIPAALYRTSPQGEILDANPALVQMLGYPDIDSLIKTNVNDIYVDPRDRIEQNTLLEHTGIVRGAQFRLKTYNNEIIWVQDSTIIVRDNKGNVLYYEGSIENITDRVLAFNERQATEKFYRILFEQSPDAVFILDLEGHHVDVNQQAANMLGYGLEELKSLSAWDVSAQTTESNRILDRILREERIQPYERIYRKKNGETIPVEIHLDLIRDTKGQPYRIQSIVRDISERKRAENEIQKQLHRLKALHSIDNAISGSFELKFILRIILEQVSEQLGVDAVCLLLLDPNSQRLAYAAGRGFFTRALQHTELKVGEGYAGKAALERRAIHIPDLRGRTTDFLRSPHFHKENFVAYFAVPVVAKGQLRGVLEIFNRAPMNPDPEWINFFENLAGQVSIAVDNAQLFEGLQRANMDLIQAYDATIEGWSRALDLRDEETEGHTQRVTQKTMQLAKEMGINDAVLAHIRRGALLHDIGKMGVPDRILLKPGPLTDEEWEIMRKHPRFAYDMLSPIAYLQPALDIPFCHHEKWDGTGYPRGLKGDEIPLAARIFAVVDVWDALSSNRPYRTAWSREKVLDHLRLQSGKHFDPEVVDVFLRLLEELGL